MNDDKEPSPLPRYRVYDRLAWEEFWLKSRFRTQYANDDYAIYQQGNLAWTMNRNKLESKSPKYNLYIGKFSNSIGIKYFVHPLQRNTT